MMFGEEWDGDRMKTPNSCTFEKWRKDGWCSMNYDGLTYLLNSPTSVHMMVQKCGTEDSSMFSARVRSFMMAHHAHPRTCGLMRGARGYISHTPPRWAV